MTFTAVVTAHAASPRKIITNLLTQTRRPDEILVYISDPTPEALEEIAALEDAPFIETFIVPNRDDWGHEKRAMGLERATGDVIGWFNHDDEYEDDYIRALLYEIEEGADVAYCDWTHGSRTNPWGNCEFRSGSSTSGNWIGRTALIRSVGYGSRQYDADGQIINGVLATNPSIVKVLRTLYHHNP